MTNGKNKELLHIISILHGAFVEGPIWIWIVLLCLYGKEAKILLFAVYKWGFPLPMKHFSFLLFESLSKTKGSKYERKTEVQESNSKYLSDLRICDFLSLSQNTPENFGLGIHLRKQFSRFLHELITCMLNVIHSQSFPQSYLRSRDYYQNIPDSQS